MTMDDLTALQKRSVREFPDKEGFGANHFVISLAASADEFYQWGTNQLSRDRQLRLFVPTESWIASTISNLSARNAAFSWSLEGPERTCGHIQEALHLSNFGKGWSDLIMKGSFDLYTQDNGWFIEVIRDSNGAFMGLGHLDAGRCQRTGNPEVPVIYTDSKGAQHKMAWNQVVDMSDFPSPIESMNGVGMCAVSRVLRISQILRDVHLRKHEKLTGRFAGVLHIISGIKKEMIDDAFREAEEESDTRGRSRYQPPIIVGTVDPNAKVEKETVALADIPEDYNEDTAFKWYVAILALAFHCEYQDLAPLPGGNLGTSQQSEILHLKARGKGPELFQKMIEHALNFRVLPKNVQFKFVERDYATEQQEALVKKLRAEAQEKYLMTGLTTPQIGRQMMQDDGDLKPEYLEMLNEEDLTPDRRIEDERREEEPGGPEEHLEDDEKALSNDDYWGRQRIKLEKEYEDDITQVLAEIGKRTKKRVRQEVMSES